MRKNFGAKPYLYPQPVMIIGTYDENGNANAMNAAWGGMAGANKIMIDLSSHKTTDNIQLNRAFTVSVGDVKHLTACDYVGMVSAHNAPDKMEKAGFTTTKSDFVNAQLVERVRSGFSKPSRILLKIPLTTQNCTVTVCKNAEHDCAEMSSMIAQKCTPNQRNKNDLKDSHLIRTTDAHLTLGEYHNVFLTEKEYKRLKADFSGLDDLIEQLSAYIQSTGKRYADHAATLRIWAKRQKTEQKSTPGIPDYTFKEGESL